MRINELETLDAFDAALADGLSQLHGWHLQSLDLSERSYELSRITVAGGVFLGCRFAPGEIDGGELDVRRRGGLVFPRVPEVPVNPYRSTLYSPEELYAGLESSYAETCDAAAYAWAADRRTLGRTLAAALHDHAIDDALEEFTAGRDIVGVLGGHSLRRNDAAYARAVHLGQQLATEFTLATGGGPGAMEAANLGAWLSPESPSSVTEALGVLGSAPDFSDATLWARTAFEVRRRWPTGVDSLGIPTWHYGHEPPNAFANLVAKYFSNATREDVLLKTCRAGLVFLPGAAGTVQEIFQAACANYYAQAETIPMILVGTEHWTERLDVWGLLGSLAEGRPFSARLDIVDDPEEVLPLLMEYRGDRG